MLQIVLSLGAIYAFIPVIIIIILLLAARGSIGGDFFEVFGITSIITGAQFRGGGAGSGISGRGKAYKISSGKGGKTLKTTEATNDIIKDFGRFKTADAGAKHKLLGKMENSDIRKMVSQNGSDKLKAAAGNTNDTEREKLVALAAGGLPLSAISNYYKTNIAPKEKPGTPPPAPGGPGSTKGFTNMSIGDFYSSWYKARMGGMRSQSGAAERANSKANSDAVAAATSGWSSSQLAALLMSKGAGYSPEMSRANMAERINRSFGKKDVEDFSAQHKELFGKGQGQISKEQLDTLAKRHTEERAKIQQEHDRQIKNAQQNHAETQRKLQQKHQKIIDDLAKKHDDEIAKFKKQHEKDIGDERDATAKQLEQMQKAHEQELNKTVKSANKIMNSYEKNHDTHMKSMQKQQEDQRKETVKRQSNEVDDLINGNAT